MRFLTLFQTETPDEIADEIIRLIEVINVINALDRILASL